MKTILFAIHDVKSEAFVQPFTMHRPGQATRAFADCINSENHHFGKNPADYTLFQLGTFDDSTAEIEITPKLSLGNGVEFINSSPQTSENPNEIRDDPQIQPSPES